MATILLNKENKIKYMDKHYPARTDATPHK